ncbi:MAG: FAD-dependent oxidoreductase [Candidatus Lokiarchaeota archaeon]|nr:FAD-dependent oxidoreductase [Candidatus Lokiarchaeota archaeon]MBD3198566.1 FAD-dependent oxidoreductase [Candidatus Lokiarchaeota archaeon]
MKNEKFDFIIIGGGIAGLHIGALLSQHGKVVILEKSHEYGGRARVENLDGFKLDYGVHPIRFGPNSALGTSLLEINKSVSFIKPGKSWAFLKNEEKTFYPTGGLLAIIKSSMVPFIPTLKLLLNVKKMEEKDFRSLYEISLEDWFEKMNIGPELRKFLTMTSSAIQVNPFINRSSAGELLHNINRVLSIGSVYYPKGGWESLFTQFTQKIKENQGDLRLRSEVKEIIVEDGIATNVKLEDVIIKGKHIISTIPVQNLFSILNEDLCNKDFVSKCRNLRHTAGISIDFCLDKKISNIDGMIFMDEPLAFGIIPSNLSPEITPENKSLMSFLRVTNIEDIQNKSRADKLYQEFRDRILEIFPDIEKSLIQERPLFLNMIDGVEINIDQHQYKRPGNQIDNISNLWLCGDSVGGEGAGGDVGHTSVRDCYEKILGSITN